MLHVRHEAGRQHKVQIGIADYLVGNVNAIQASRVARLRDHTGILGGTEALCALPEQPIKGRRRRTAVGESSWRGRASVNVT